MYKHFVSLIFILGLILFFNVETFAQQKNIVNQTSIDINNLTDAQIKQMVDEWQANGSLEKNWEEIAQSKGWSAADLEQIKTRLAQINKSNFVNKNIQSTSRTIPNTVKNSIKPRSENETKIFGSDLFSNGTITFEPNLRLATPSNYIIGPDDEIGIDIYGYSEASYRLKVSPDGNLFVPTVGIIALNGLNMEQARERIKSRLSKIYTGIQTGATSVTVSLGNIRSIKVIITGEIVKPGTYTLPSVATVFNALYASGGPNENGSMRYIQLIRNGQLKAKIDIYDFLMQGNLKNNITLQDQDVIHIPTYETKVKINGAVKREGFFEIKHEEHLDDALHYAGGFTEKAFRNRIKIIRNTTNEKRIEEVTSASFNQFSLQSGDEILVDEILNRFENRVQIQGAVFRPGAFELNEGMTLKSLLQKAEGLKEDAFLNRGIITRTKSDLTTEIINFETQNILNGKAKDITLIKEDVVLIPSIFDLKESYQIEINGAVRNPGTFKYADNMSLETLIILAGGFKEGATPKRIEIARRIRNTQSLKDTTTLAQIFYVDVEGDLKQSTNQFSLQPFDIVSVRQAPGYQKQKTVQIEGEVLFPGNYIVTNKNERISTLIQRAGGITTSAYLKGASLQRNNRTENHAEINKETIKKEQIENLQKATNDSVDVDFNKISTRNNFVGIDLPSILKKPGSRHDLLVEDGDIIFVPKLLQTVKVSGEVLSPSSIVYQPSISFKNYVRKAGGYTPKGMKKNAYIVYANGAIASTKRYLVFNIYPSVQPGAEIFIPTKEDRRNRLSTSEIVALTTGLATIATLIFSVTR